MEAKLIEKIKENPFLYDKREKKYRNINAKERKWREIAVDLCLPVATIKKRWVTLRDRYNREKKVKLSASESGATSPKKEWKFFQLMRFMDDAPSTNLTNIEKYEEEIANFAEEDYEDDTNVVTVGLLEPVMSTTPCTNESTSTTRSWRRSRGADMSVELREAQNETSEVLQLTKSSSASSTQLFFASVALSIDEANLSPHAISRIKLRVQSVIHKELYEKSNHYN